MNHKTIILPLVAALMMIAVGVHICLANFNQHVGCIKPVQLWTWNKTTENCWEVSVLNQTATLNVQPVVQCWTRLAAHIDSRVGKGHYQVQKWWQDFGQQSDHVEQQILKWKDYIKNWLKWPPHE